MVVSRWWSWEWKLHWQPKRRRLRRQSIQQCLHPSAVYSLAHRRAIQTFPLNTHIPPTHATDQPMNQAQKRWLHRIDRFFRTFTEVGFDLNDVPSTKQFRSYSPPHPQPLTAIKNNKCQCLRTFQATQTNKKQKKTDHPNALERRSAAVRCVFC